MGLPTWSSLSFDTSARWVPLAARVFQPELHFTITWEERPSSHLYLLYFPSSRMQISLHFLISETWITFHYFKYGIVAEFSFLRIYKIMVRPITDDILESMNYGRYWNLWGGGWLFVWILQKLSRWIWCTLMVTRTLN